MLSPMATVLDTYFVNQDYVAVPQWVRNVSEITNLNFRPILKISFSDQVCENFEKVESTKN